MSENASNETAIVGGRPGVGTMYDGLSRQASGLPPKGSIPVAIRPQVAESLPMIGVARQVLGHEIQRMRQAESAIERDLARPPSGANWIPNPYLVEQHRLQRQGLEDLREEIERLSRLDDEQTRMKAYKLGAQ